MCNLYSITTNQAAIIALFRVVNRYVGNLAPMPGVFPNYNAPIVRNGAEGRELATARWGMPSSSKALRAATKKRAEKLQAKGKTVDFKELLRMEPDGGTTNIRNVKSKHWTRWLEVLFGLLDYRSRSGDRGDRKLRHSTDTEYRRLAAKLAVYRADGTVRRCLLSPRLASTRPTK